MAESMTTTEGAQRASGIRVISGRWIQCPPDITADHEALIDFDQHTVDAPGLYAIELVQGNAVTWRGCRELRPGADCAIEARDDLTGWGALDLSAFRIAGKVVRLSLPTGWKAIVIVDGGTDGGVEVGERLWVTTKATRDEALAAAKELMLADMSAIGFTAEPVRLAA